MGETGKRFRNSRDSDTDGRAQKRRPSFNKEKVGDGELVVYRILCPDRLIGSVIGKGGKVINALRQETNAKIKVVDPYPGADHRVITIYCFVNKTSMDVDDDDMIPLCAAQDALLKVHASIANAVGSFGESDKKNKVEARILVPASQAASVIGKSGATIKKMRANTGANIKVNPKDPSDPTHSCAMSFDNFISITGDAEAVKRALFSVSAIMYRFSPREEISLDTTVPDLQGGIIIPSDMPVFPTGSFYPNVDAVTPASRPVPPALGVTSHLSEYHGYTNVPGSWSAYPSAMPAVTAYGGASRSEELTVRILCPLDKIGRVIGKGGISIRNVRQASGARVEVDDKKNKTEECVITVTSTESTDDAKSATIEAVLLLQEKINDEDDDKVRFRLLVPSKVIGCLIGKGGSIINEMRKATKADIRISKGDKPACAAENEELVEVFGEAPSLRNAILQIILRLRDDILQNRDAGDSVRDAPTEPLYSSGLSLPPSILPSVQSVPPLGFDQRVEAGAGMGLKGASLYGYNSLQDVDGGYGSFSSYPSKSYGRSPPYEVPIPSNAVAKVLGKGGANLANIQKLSGATIDIVDSKYPRSGRVAQISGTMEQKHMAENMIQAFIMST